MKQNSIKRANTASHLPALLNQMADAIDRWLEESAATMQGSSDTAQELKALLCKPLKEAFGLLRKQWPKVARQMRRDFRRVLLEVRHVKNNDLRTVLPLELCVSRFSDKLWFVAQHLESNLDNERKEVRR